MKKSALEVKAITDEIVHQLYQKREKQAKTPAFKKLVSGHTDKLKVINSIGEKLRKLDEKINLLEKERNEAYSQFEAEKDKLNFPTFLSDDWYGLELDQEKLLDRTYPVDERTIRRQVILSSSDGSDTIIKKLVEKFGF